MSPERLAAIKERCDGALEGPWVVETNYGYEPGEKRPYYWITDKDGRNIVSAESVKLFDDRDTIHFIAQARTIIPELVAEVERLQGALEVEEQMRIQDYKNATKKSSYATGWEIP